MNKVYLKDNDTYLEYFEQNHKIYQNSDLVPSIYEGGYKLWECSYDLLNYIQESVKFSGLNVIELGCGIGLPGLYALLLGANVIFQDYNQEVIQNATIPTIKSNLLRLGHMADYQRAEFMFGSWKCLEPKQCDIILTSETIYNEGNYGDLIGIMVRCLKENGVIIVAAKKFYFGVGGGINQFKDFVAKDKRLKIYGEHVISNGLGNIRGILLINKTI